MGRAAQSLGEDLGPAVQPDRRPAAVERPSVARIDDRAATGRDHPADVGRRVGRTEVGDGRPLERSEGGLALLLEDVRDRSPRSGLDALVEVDERRAVAIGEPAPDDALAAAGQSDEYDVHRPPQSSPPEPASSVPVSPWPAGTDVSAAARPPATGGSGAAAIRSR